MSWGLHSAVCYAASHSLKLVSRVPGSLDCALIFRRTLSAGSLEHISLDRFCLQEFCLLLPGAQEGGLIWNHYRLIFWTHERELLKTSLTKKENDPKTKL